MLFEAYLLSSYNYNVGSLLLLNCVDCYNRYRNADIFKTTIIDNRGSYMGCLQYESSIRTRITHCSVPIMIGSYIDFCIRGAETVIENRALWGLVILRGQLKIYDNFSTFDALSMHVHQTKNTHSINWFTYIGDDGLALNYNRRIITAIFKQQTYYNTTNPDIWIDCLQRSNPFHTIVYADDYLTMFDTILRQEYSMNDLKIRQILNGPKIMRKYIVSDLNRRKKQTSGNQKMAVAFESGSLFQVLSKKNAFSNDEWHKNYPQNYDSTMHDGRSNKTAHFLPTISRASNAAIRNSNALTFPTDAVYYFCMLNTKDLKSAGEQNVLADYVIMSEDTDQMSLFHHLQTLNTNTGDILTINGYLINCRCVWTLQHLIDVKRKFPHVTTQYNLPYIRFSTRDCIPIKYNQEHNVFFSPAETTHFRIVYPERDLLSITAKELQWHSLCKTPPAKSTVSINNIKGSIAKVTSQLHKQLMQNSLGITCYMNMTQTTIESLIEYAVISHNNDTSDFFRCYREMAHEFKIPIDEDECRVRLSDIDETTPQVALDALRVMYPEQKLLNAMVNLQHMVTTTTNSSTTVTNPDNLRLQHRANLQEYTNLIYGLEHFRTPNIWNLKLRAAFGNPYGGCIEDGVVIDTSILPHIAPIHYNACFTIEFTFKTIKQPNDSVFVPIDERHGNIGGETLIGCLISEHPTFAKRSKHSKVIQCRLGDQYYYLIHFMPKKTKMYDNLEVRHIRTNNIITIIIKGENKVFFGVGSKIANSFGQKNIVSMATNELRDKCWGITRTGKKVHAQIIYSDVSLISRLLSGQIYDMFLSDELALGPDNTIIAPVNLIIHTLHPYTNIKVFDIKVDTLTNINGFDAQNLCSVSNFLRTDKVDAKVLQVIGLHGYSIKTNLLNRYRPKITFIEEGGSVSESNPSSEVPAKRHKKNSLSNSSQD
jgi:hypothetical protein